MKTARIEDADVARRKHDARDVSLERSVPSTPYPKARLFLRVRAHVRSHDVFQLIVVDERHADKQVARLFAAGAPVVCTDPHPENVRAIRAYQNAGF